MASICVDIELEDFDDNDLIAEVKARGFHVFEDYATSTDEDLEQIYLLRRRGLPYDHLMDAYIYKVLGKVL
jgi:hypothetical protein